MHNAKNYTCNLGISNVLKYNGSTHEYVKKLIVSVLPWLEPASHFETSKGS